MVYLPDSFASSLALVPSRLFPHPPPLLLYPGVIWRSGRSGTLQLLAYSEHGDLQDLYTRDYRAVIAVSTAAARRRTLTSWDLWFVNNKKIKQTKNSLSITFFYLKKFEIKID